jgi:hypothetical protein
MSYKNVLAALKSKAPEDKMLLGGAWTRERHSIYYDKFSFKRAKENYGSNRVTPPEHYPSCGCALAELVPGMVQRIAEKTTYDKENPGFSCVFDEITESFNGMTYHEAEMLEYKNDNCMPMHANNKEDCQRRALLVEAYLEEKVKAEVELAQERAEEAKQELSRKVEAKSPT